MSSSLNREVVTVSIHRCLIIMVLVSFLGISSGCSGDPVGPDIDTGDTGLKDQSSSAVHHCLGFYTGLVDTKTCKVEVFPVRSADLHVNVTGVLNTTMGVSAVGVPSEADPANGYFVFDIILTHPFATKPQLAGFLRILE